MSKNKIKELKQDLESAREDMRYFWEKLHAVNLILFSKMSNNEKLIHLERVCTMPDRNWELEKYDYLIDRVILR